MEEGKTSHKGDVFMGLEGSQGFQKAKMKRESIPGMEGGAAND